MRYRYFTLTGKRFEEFEYKLTDDQIFALRFAPDSELAALVEEAAPAEEQGAASIAPAAKKGRPSMPSWDEIVFGTKTDD